MATSVTRTDIAWGYIAQALNIGAGIILLPVILYYLPPEDVGLWFVFVTLGSLAQLLEFGFQPTLVRNTAYVYAGAKELVHKGLPPPPAPGQPLNHALLKELVQTSRHIYRIVALVCFITLLGGGTAYIYSVLTPEQNPVIYLGAWTAFAFGYIATFYYGYFNGLLLGRGDISKANKVIIFTRGSLIILGATFVALGYGLPGLGMASLMSALLGRWIAHQYYFSKDRPEAREAHSSAHQPPKLLGTLWHNSWRLGAVNLGAFLIQRASILIATSSLGLAASASYSMTITILMALSSVSIVIANIQLPHMSVLQAGRSRDQLKEIFGEIVILSWGVFLCGLLIIAWFGNSALSAISSQTPLLPTPELLALGVILLLELNHSVAAAYLTTKNEIPFLNAALLSGIAIVVLAAASIGTWGVWGLIFAQGVVQLAYNNWKWPYLALNDLGTDVLSLMKSGVRRIATRIA